MANQFARNVWSTGLEINSNAAKTVFTKSGNLNWATATLAQQDETMFATLILVVTTTVPSRSILVDNPYRGVPSKKLQSFLDVTEKDEDTDDSTRPLFNYVNFLLGKNITEGLEVDILKVDLEANTNVGSETVDLLCQQLSSVELASTDAVQTTSVVRELTRKYTHEEL